MSNTNSESAKQHASSLISSLLKDVKGMAPAELVQEEAPEAPAATPAANTVPRRTAVPRAVVPPKTAPTVRPPAPTPAPTAEEKAAAAALVDPLLPPEELQMVLARMTATMSAMEKQLTRVAERVLGLPGDAAFLKAVVNSLVGSGILTDAVRDASGSVPSTATVSEPAPQLVVRVTEAREPTSIMRVAFLDQDHPTKPNSLDCFMLDEAHGTWVPCGSLKDDIAILVETAMGEMQAQMNRYYYVAVDQVRTALARIEHDTRKA